MPKAKKSAKLSSDYFIPIAAPGEALYSSFTDEETRVDYLTLADYRNMLDNDGQIQMLWNAVVNTIMSAGVEIQEDKEWALEEPSPERQFLEKQLFAPLWKGGMKRSLEITNRTMLRAWVEGFRVFEVVYKVGDDGLVYIDYLAPRAGLNDYELKLLVNDTGDFFGFQQRVSFKGRIVDVRVANDGPLKKAVKATYGEEFGSVYGRPGLKAAWYHYDKVHKAMYLNHRALENGAQKAMFFYHRGSSADTAKIRAVVDMLARRQDETVFALEKDFGEVKVEELSNAQAMAEGKEMINLHYSMIAKSILAQFADLGSTVSSTGSRSLASEQLSFFKVGLQAIAKILIEDTWNPLLADLLKVNFNSGIYPQLHVKPIADEKVAALSEAFMEVIRKGNIPSAVNDAISLKGSEALGLGVSEEEIAEKESEPVVAQPLVPAMPQSADMHDHISLDDYQPERVQRSLFLDEQKVRFTDISSKLVDSEDRATRILREKLAKQKDGIVQQYLEAIRSGRKSISNTKVELAENTYSEELRAIGLELLNYGKVAAANELGVKVPETTAKETNALVDNIDSAVDEQETRLALRLSSIARNALNSNLPENDTRLLLQQEYDDFFDKIINPTVAIIVPQSLNQGRSVTFKKYEGEIFAYRYSAVLDSNTTDYCRSLDGRVFQATDPDFFMLTPPNHFGCRSIWVPITKEEAQQQGVQVDGKPADLPVFGSVSSFKDQVGLSDSLEVEIQQLIEKL